MNGKKAFVLLAVGALGTVSSAWARKPVWPERGGFVLPCSLDGVNPVYHPGIFGNPAMAYREYGFVQSRDGTWHVEKNCVRGLNHN
jgi:hypothetical protein